MICLALVIFLEGLILCEFLLDLWKTSRFKILFVPVKIKRWKINYYGYHAEFMFLLFYVLCYEFCVRKALLHFTKYCNNHSIYYDSSMPTKYGLWSEEICWVINQLRFESFFFFLSHGSPTAPALHSWNLETWNFDFWCIVNNLTLQAARVDQLYVGKVNKTSQSHKQDRRSLSWQRNWPRVDYLYTSDCNQERAYRCHNSLFELGRVAYTFNRG
jgi:hypothetical protein